MKRLIVIFLGSILLSCGNEVSKGSIIGTWACLVEGEYTEIEFDSTSVYIFGNWQANMGSYGYTIKEDTIKYVESEYSARMEFLSENTIILTNESISDTIYRVIRPGIRLSSLDLSDSLKLLDYVKDFKERANEFCQNRGLDEINDGEWNIQVEDELIIK